MKTLIVYFTRTGTTRILAEALAKQIDADIEELKDANNWQGPIGYLLGGKAAFKKELTTISELAHSVADYDLIVIATPVWAGTMAPAARTFITEQKNCFKKIAFLATQGGAREQNVFRYLQELSGLAPAATLWLTTKDVKQGNYTAPLSDFVQKIKA